jgi:GTP-binding protein HflX
LFERPQAGARAILVQVDLRSDRRQGSREEFHQLAVSAGLEPVAIIGGTREKPDPRLFVGTGKADEIQARISETRAQLVLFNHALTPVQERNLEAHLKCRVLDRTGLILDIFAQRARTFEGKLQVELAQLKHLATRLVRGWSHLERQKGGIGLRGPGETQLETDRRLIGRRIKQLNKRLERVRRHRELSRRSRRRATVTAVSLVGYTNAGKSTLFNRLTGAQVYEADQLFATLDPTLRRCELPGLGHVVLADTVGFISDLPPDLVAAFHATLEETVEADLLLHVIDSHDDAHLQQVEEVNRILSAIGASHIPQIEVYNKIDLRYSDDEAVRGGGRSNRYSDDEAVRGGGRSNGYSDDEAVRGGGRSNGPDGEPRIDYDASGQPKRVWISARTGIGVEALQHAIAQRLLSDRSHGSGRRSDAIDPEMRHNAAASQYVQLRLRPTQGRLRAQLFEWNVVRGERAEDGDWLVDVILKPGLLSYLERHDASFVDGDASLTDAPKLAGMRSAP